MHQSGCGSTDIADIGRGRMDAASIQLAQVEDGGAIVANAQKEPRQAGYPPQCGGTRLKGEFAEGSADQPLVTVVTAVLNGQPYVQGCLESVLRQDYPNIEHILVDGGSSDGTVDVLRRYDDRVALWTSEPNGGLYDAWNKALPDARGEWICFIGIDDELLPGAVSAYMALAARNPEAEYLNSLVRMVHYSGYERTFGRPWKWREFSKWMRWAQVGTMHRRSLLNRLGPYDLSFGGVGDYEFLATSTEWTESRVYTGRDRNDAVGRRFRQAQGLRGRDARENRHRRKECADGRNGTLDNDRPLLPLSAPQAALLSSAPQVRCKACAEMRAFTSPRGRPCNPSPFVKTTTSYHPVLRAYCKSSIARHQQQNRVTIRYDPHPSICILRVTQKQLLTDLLIPSKVFLGCFR